MGKSHSLPCLSRLAAQLGSLGLHRPLLAGHREAPTLGLSSDFPGLVSVGLGTGSALSAGGQAGGVCQALGRQSPHVCRPLRLCTCSTSPSSSPCSPSSLGRSASLYLPSLLCCARYALPSQPPVGLLPGAGDLQGWVLCRAGPGPRALLLGLFFGSLLQPRAPEGSLIHLPVGSALSFLAHLAADPEH